MWDTSEYIAAVKVLGLPHPPGNPLFVLLGHAFALLPIPVSYAARINMFVALLDAIAAGLWFLVTERILSHWLALRWQRIAGAPSRSRARFSRLREVGSASLEPPSR